MEGCRSLRLWSPVPANERGHLVHLPGVWCPQALPRIFRPHGQNALLCLISSSVFVGGNMLSSLAQSDLYRAGVIALLKDIMNGNLPERARQLLLASRLVALTKTEGKYRPIAVGELFARLAGKLAVRKVTSAAAALLAPHQLGVGVASGAERIVHSLQHTLTDKGRRHALLKLDISNAFNSCDRARALRVLYEQPALSAMWRIADFAYAAPSLEPVLGSVVYGR